MNKKHISADKLLEKYKFYRLCSIDFDTTIHSTRILKRYKRLDVRYALLRDITVTYARPFSKNKGKLFPSHTLKANEFVPREARELHNELIDLRNQSFAHTDIPYYNPKVINWSSPGVNWFPMAFRGSKLENLNKKTDDLLYLVKNVQINLQNMIIAIEDEIVKID